jgi:glutamate carboxypeptidase
LIRALLVLLAFIAAAPAQAQLAEPDRRAIQAVDRDAARHVALLERLVNNNSGTLNLPGVRREAELMRPEFEALGMEVRWVDMAATGRAGHLIATHRNRTRTRAKHILLIGHLDTVFEPDSPFQSWKREGDRAVGPGVADMKGGNVIMLAALRALHATGQLRRMDVTVFLTGDEERIGAPVATARRDLIAAAQQADYALEFEGLARVQGRDHSTVARRSSTNWTLTARARTGHSSRIFSNELGYGAVYEMARILDTFRRELPEANLTFNVGVLGGGTPAALDAQEVTVTATGKTNVIPEAAVARGDIRSLTVEQDQRIRARMQQIVAQHLPGTSAELVFAEGGYPPMAPSPGNVALLARLNEVNRALGLPEMPPMDPALRGAADSGFVAPHVDTLAGLGMAGGGAHAIGEWADLTSLPLQAKRAALLMQRLSQAQTRRTAVSR